MNVFINSDAWNFWINEDLSNMDRDEIIAAMKRDVDFYNKPGVEAVFYNMNFQRCFFNTKVGTRYDKDCAIGPDGKLTLRGQPIPSLEGEESPESTYRMMFLNFKNCNEKCPDLMTLRYKYCHEVGLEMWHSMRMNDVHHSQFHSEFRPQHSDLWLDRKEELTRAWHRHQQRLVWSDNCFDYGISEVFEYHLNLVREYLLDWESDGIELDWLRCLPVFKPGFDEFNSGLLTEFMRETRKAAKEAEKKWGHRVRIAVRVPGRVREAFANGMNVGDWAKENLFDIIVPSATNTSTEQDYDIAVFKALAPNQIVAPDIDFSIRGARTGCISFTRESDAGFISNFYQQGADGIYFFNHFPRALRDKPWANEVFELAADRSAAARAARRHFVTYHDCVGEGVFEEITFPRWIWAKCANGGVRINCGENVKGRKAVAVIGATCELDVDLLVNTVKCKPSAEPLPSPLYKGGKDNTVNYVIFDIPADVLHDGFNNLEIYNNSSTHTITWDEITWMEVSIPSEVQGA